MLSNTSKYAIRAIIYIALNAKENEKIGIKQISKDLDIPTPFLGKILQTMARHKLLSSTKGPHGGFGIGKNPYEISILDIVEVIDGLDSFNDCVLGLRSCTENKQHCPIHPKFGNLRDQMKELFQVENIGQLADLIRESGSKVIL
jgi:Rrf2 family protein